LARCGGASPLTIRTLLKKLEDKIANFFKNDLALG
jgi:hypothetical protein